MAQPTDDEKPVVDVAVPVLPRRARRNPTDPNEASPPLRGRVIVHELRIELADHDRAEALRRRLQSLLVVDMVPLDGHWELRIDLIESDADGRVANVLDGIDSWLAEVGAYFVRVHLDGRSHTLYAPRHLVPPRRQFALRGVMIDRPGQQAPEAQDEDAALAPGTATWFARALGEDWLEEEVGIYRHVGARADDLPPAEPLGRGRGAAAPPGDA